MKFWLPKNFQMRNEAEVHFADFRGWRLAADKNNLVHDLAKDYPTRGNYFLYFALPKRTSLAEPPKSPLVLYQ